MTSTKRMTLCRDGMGGVVTGQRAGLLGKMTIGRYPILKGVDMKDVELRLRTK